MTTIDRNGQEICLTGKSVMNIFPYRPAADELDGCDGTMPGFCSPQRGRERPTT